MPVRFRTLQPGEVAVLLCKHLRHHDESRRNQCKRSDKHLGPLPGFRHHIAIEEALDEVAHEFEIDSVRFRQPHLDPVHFMASTILRATLSPSSTSAN